MTPAKTELGLWTSYRCAYLTCGFILLHLSLDWLGQRYADAAQSITSWNPAAGLGIVLVSICGRRSAGLILPTTFISSLLLRGQSESTALAAGEGLIVGTVYTIAALALASPRLGFDQKLNALKDLILLMTVALISSAVGAISYLLLLAVSGNIAYENLFGPFLQYWIGDLISIVVVVPFGLLALGSRLHFDLTRSRLLFIVVTAILVVVAISFREFGGFTYFYFLFFPVIWAALVDGFKGVVPLLALIQFGVYAAIILLKIDLLDVSHFQARMIALSATGLIAGILVSERQRLEAHNRIHQQALAQVALRGGMGQFGAAIAHEVNQPLSAAGTYAGLVAESLATETLRDPTVIENARKVAHQIERASGVIRRLRALVKLARDDQASISPSRLVGEAAELMETEFQASGIELRIELQQGLPPLFVDRLQVEQALLNLLRNAIESIRSTARGAGVVVLYGREMTDGTVEVGVIDDGPGFAEQFSLDRLQPFTSSKEDGFGIGLSLCQSIAIANGGRLVIHKASSGAHVAISFKPTDQEYDDENA